MPLFILQHSSFILSFLPFSSGPQFGLYARAAKIYLIELIRDLCRKLLNHLEQVDPIRHAALVAEVDLTALFGAEDEKITVALKTPERAQRLQQIGRQALRLARLLSASLDQAPFLGRMTRVRCGCTWPP